MKIRWFGSLLALTSVTGLNYDKSHLKKEKHKKNQSVSERIQEYKEQTWESSPGQCVPFSSVILSQSLSSVVLVECDEPESECYFKCLNHNKPRIRRTRCICKTYSEKRRRRKQLGDEQCDWSRTKHINADLCSELSEEGIIKYERKDDMLFGEWQAQMMLEKGQTTEGVRVDKKIVINPLFKDFIATGRSLVGKTPAVNLGEISSSTLYDSRLDLGRAIGAVVKWDKYREGNKYVIPYFYQAGYSEELKTDISRALADLGDNTCIDFKVVNEASKDYEHKIKIVAGSGCYSYVGFQGVNHQTISLREVGCLSRGTVQHEFMHALGFYHEQARPDASKHIQIQYQNVGNMCGSTGRESCRSQFDSLPLHEWESSRKGGEYDIRSVMHYGGYDFSAEGKPTLLDMKDEPVRDQRLRFSQSDAEQICEIYKCESMGNECMGGKWECKNGKGFTYRNKLCDGLSDCADGSDEEGCIEKTCCDRVHVDGLTFIRQDDRQMNGRPFYELEGSGEDVYLYYYHDGKKNRYWLISKYINVLSVFGYSFEELMCPQEMHIRSSLGGTWKWAWAECAHEPKFGDWSAWTSCAPSPTLAGVCQTQRIRFCKGGNIGYHDGCPKDGAHERVKCDCSTGERHIALSSAGATEDEDDYDYEENRGAEWTRWSPWGSCNRSCGDGEQTRTRSCSGGVVGQGSCTGNGWKDVQNCNLEECPAWGEWGRWSQCDKTCNTGQQIRNRQCNGAKIGSDSCPKGENIETQPCGGFPCARWASWNNWSPCSRTCGASESVRVRTCIFGSIGDDGCPDEDSKDARECTQSACESKIWGPWTNWTPCTATCGTGMTMRSRNCVGNRKLCSNNDAIMQKTCNTQSCQFSLSFWSNWSDWTECSASCGGGQRTKSRNCMNGKVGTGNCQSDGDQASESCNIEECPEETVAETGCLASDLYVFKTCKNRERKPAKEIDGYYPHGTSCGNVMCSKQFFGFTWKTKTTKIVCECNNGRCGWSKPLHKCPTGCTMPPEWKGDKCTKQLDSNKNKFLKTDDYKSLSDEIMFTPRTGKCKAIFCANNPSELVKATKCNCNNDGVCDWTKEPDC